MDNYISAIDSFLDSAEKNHEDFFTDLEQAKHIWNEDQCVLLAQNRYSYGFMVEEEGEEKVYFNVLFEPVENEDDNEGDQNGLVSNTKNERTGAEELKLILGSQVHMSYALAALLLLKDNFPSHTRFTNNEHMIYTRQGMVDRVLAERRHKARKESFHIEWADNIYGNHVVYNEKGRKYHVFLRDFQSETGYSDSPDSRNNKLGTTKHIMYAFDQLKQNPNLSKTLKKECPFLEIYLDPLNQNQITWFYPHDLPNEIAPLIQEYFGDQHYLTEETEATFLGFMDKALELEERIVIREEVQQKIDGWYEKEMMDWIKEHHEVPFDQIRAELYPYQKKGVEFVTFRSGSIIADEMGLGKTLQSISAAIAKKKIFSFRKVLVICPASLKSQWKKEIERFSDEKATIIGGSYEEREAQYLSSDNYFIITNYEAVLRDFININKAGIDFLILDEAQRVKNFETKTWNAVSRLERKHILIITGTPIENKLLDIYSIMQLIDPQLLGPLWEFSYKHCMFDPERTNKITGYYDLHEVKEKLKAVLLRREKRHVLKELPQVSQMDITLKLSREQEEIHSGYKSLLSRILRKKFLTPVDLTRITMLLTNMRMVSNSTYLIDEESNFSTKLTEFEYILFEKLDICNSNSKIIVFSEWIKSHNSTLRR